MRFLLASTLALLAVTDAGATVIRHDRSDKDALTLGARFAAVCRVMPDGGCTLIAPRWVATAAHVASRLQPGSTIQFDGQTRTVTRVVIHPDGASKPGVPPEVDLALVELDRPVDGIEPVPVYRGTGEFGTTVVIVGYGDFGVAAAPLTRSDGRRRAVTNVVDDAGPMRLFVSFTSPPDGTANEGVGAAGDSGGPLLIEVNGRWHLAGVSSASKGKPGTYGLVDVYTRVSSYLAWIDEVIVAR
jgi:hypothetical protein